MRTSTGPSTAEAVLDTSVAIHLAELGLLRVLGAWDLAAPPAVQRELAQGGQGLPPGVAVQPLRPTDLEAVIDAARASSLSATDAELVVLAHALGASLVFTDDLRLRQVVRLQRLRPVGTLGLILRAVRDGSLRHGEAVAALERVPASTLFVTQTLLDEARDALDRLGG